MLTSALKWTGYIPHVPTPKQRAFLMLPHRDAFYGGALGGGKSDALLMAALQYVDVPGYSGIIFRRKISDLKLAGNLIDRSRQWLVNSPAKYNGSQHEWIFPTGGEPAKIAFGYLESIEDKYRYQGAEFHYIAFDEASQLREGDINYLITRARRTTAIKAAGVPIRVRLASNPGGQGHLYIKRRYAINKVAMADGTVKYIGQNPERPYIPAYITDNPHLVQDEYINDLKRSLDPVTLAQLLSGDWGVSAAGRFRPGWVRRYAVMGSDHYNPQTPWTCRDAFIKLLPDDAGVVRSSVTAEAAALLDRIARNEGVKAVHGSIARMFSPERLAPSANHYYIKDCELFQTVDLATSSKDGPNATTTRTGEACWTVISTWLRTPLNDLILWHVERFQDETPGVIDRVFRSYTTFQPAFVGIEDNGINRPIYQLITAAGIPTVPLKPESTDKIARAAVAQARMERGQIYYPHPDTAQGVEWLHTFEEENFTWSGLPDEESDQIDTLAFAALYVQMRALGLPVAGTEPQLSDGPVDPIPDTGSWSLPPAW